MTPRFLAASRGTVNGGLNRSAVLLALALSVGLYGVGPATAVAQEGRALPAPTAAAARYPLPSGDASWDALLGEDPAAELSDLALAQRQDKLVEGWILLGVGLASIVAGGLIAAIGHEDEALLTAGLTTASWGAINGAFALPLFDLGGGGEARARTTRELRGLALLERRDELAGAQRTSAAIFALNAGLDILYISGAVLLMALGAVEDPDEAWMLGAGAAILPQGLFLLAFDVLNWVGARARAGALEAAVP